MPGTLDDSRGHFLHQTPTVSDTTLSDLRSLTRVESVLIRIMRACPASQCNCERTVRPGRATLDASTLGCVPKKAAIADLCHAERVSGIKSRKSASLDM